jgi:hypothetical protein
MKRLLAVFTLCATAAIAASTLSSPAAADGRHDGRRHAGPYERQTSWNFTQRDRRHYKFRRHHKRQRYARRHFHRYSPRPGYGYGRPRYRYSYRTGSAYAFAFDGSRFIFRFD